MQDSAELPTRLGTKLYNSRFSLQTRRTVTNTAVPHERILELAMDSRGARIEREKLLRQNHLIHSGQNGLLSKTKRIRSSLIVSNSIGFESVANGVQVFNPSAEPFHVGQ